MNDASLSEVEARNLRFLRRLVTVLTATMILGLLTIVVLLVIRLTGAPGLADLPAAITLPEGVAAVAFTQGTDWYAVVTDDDRILVFDRENGTLRQSISVNTDKP